MLQFDEHYPPLLADLATDLRARLVRAGIDADLADRVAFEHAEHFRTQWGGGEPYIAKGHQYELAKRNREIVAKFNGRNQKALCQEYALSRVQLYEIIKRGRQDRREAGEPSTGTDG